MGGDVQDRTHRIQPLQTDLDIRGTGYRLLGIKTTRQGTEQQ
jgi:hypothetical protein